VGHRLEINPLLVFLAVWFGGWMWGIAGITIAVPALLALKVAAEHSERGQPLVAFLSPGRSKARRRAGLSIEAMAGPVRLDKR
jgi:predicted PurR-regulated permease PerM